MRTDRARHVDVPWRLIIGMRHHLVHGYFDIDPDIVWTAIAQRIPQLRQDIERILATDQTVASHDESSHPRDAR